MDYTDLTEKGIDSQNIYKGKIIDVYRDSVLLPNGETGTREYIKHVGAVCVVPVTENKEVLVVKQYRYPFKDVLTEIPAGKLDGKNEPPLEAAVRELREETGASAREMIYMGEYYPTCAYSDEVIHMYLAKGLTFGTASPDEDEFIEAEAVPLPQLVSDIMNGKICDGKTQTAVLKANMLINGCTP